MRPREELYARINQRVLDQIRAGLVDEVARLLERGLDEDDVSMKGLGYKEIIGYLKGRYDLDEAVRLLQRDTRRYARRQLTWFRADPRIRWLDLSEFPSMSAAVEHVYDAVVAHVAGAFRGRPRKPPLRRPAPAGISAPPGTHSSGMHTVDRCRLASTASPAAARDGGRRGTRGGVDWCALR